MLVHPGIRSWGLPRIYVISIALAVLATTRQDSEVVAFRASGNESLPLELNSREKIVQYMEILETALHPGDAIGSFVDRLIETESNMEPLLIVDRSEFDDLEFQQGLAQSYLNGALFILVDRHGHFELARWSKSGLETIRRSKLSLERLLKRSANKLVSNGLIMDLSSLLLLVHAP